MRIAIIGRTEVLYEAAVLLLEQGHEITLIITSKAAPEYKRTEQDFERLAKSCNAKFIYTSKINTVVNEIKGRADIGVSVNYAGLISKEVIDCFPMGILNAHGGDLPRYRGNACQAWAIINGEEKIGLCIHRMIGGELDSGNIIARSYYPLSLNTKIGQVWTWMETQVPVMFQQAIQSLSHNPAYILESQSKDPADALRCYPRRPEDGKINWNMPAEKIIRLINASSQPYSGAFCDFEGRKLTIWDAVLAPKENYLATPGQITLIEENFIEVATSDGKVRVTRISIDGTPCFPLDVFKSIRQRLT